MIFSKGTKEKILKFPSVTEEIQMINLMHYFHPSHQRQYECKSILIKDILLQDVIKPGSDYDRHMISLSCVVQKVQFLKYMFYFHNTTCTSPAYRFLIFSIESKIPGELYCIVTNRLLFYE